MNDIFPSFLMKLTTAAPESSSPLNIRLEPAPETPAAGQPGQQVGDTLLRTLPGSQMELVVSLGSQPKRTPETFRQAGGAAARWLVQYIAAESRVDVQQFAAPAELCAFCEGLSLGAYRFDRYKSDQKPASAVHVCLIGVQDLKSAAAMLAEVDIVTRAVILAREWAHEPANIINPNTLAERAQLIASQNGLKCTVLDENALEEMKAGAILAVGKGSKTPSKLIILEYAGQNPAPDTRPVVLVGKALTFDTGGYSLKDPTNILGMKYDKCGGLDVLAMLQAAAQLKLKNPVVGIIGAAENMVSQFAYRPDDILTSLSGKTIEILSTDAEGRLVLADALTYAQRAFQPRALIDLATLTGGVVIALGHIRAGLLSNDDTLSEQLLQAGTRTHERLWRMPLDDDYLKQIKGDEADLKNSGGREASTIIGGMFLKQFVSDQVPWAHLDIAGMADSRTDLPYCPKGATGFGIRLLVDYLKALEA